MEREYRATPAKIIAASQPALIRTDAESGYGRSIFKILRARNINAVEKNIFAVHFRPNTPSGSLRSLESAHAP